MNVAISGVSSRLGAALVAALEKDERVGTVMGFDRVPPRFTSPKLRFAKRDVRDSDLERDLQGCDAVVHLAFLFQPPLPPLAEVYSVNVEGSRNLCEAAVRAGIRRILVTSSVAAYGAFPNTPQPLTESHPIRMMAPEFYYNACKVRVEKHLEDLERRHPGVLVTRFRPCAILGPWHSHAMSRRVFLNPCPDVPMQFVWVDDMVSAIVLGLSKEAPGAFNIAGDGPMTWREVATLAGRPGFSLPYHPTLWMAELTSRLGLQRRVPPGWLRMARYPVVMDCAKAKRDLGWEPRQDTRGAIRLFLEHDRRSTVTP